MLTQVAGGEIQIPLWMQQKSDFTLCHPHPRSALYHYIWLLFCLTLLSSTGDSGASGNLPQMSFIQFLGVRISSFWYSCLMWVCPDTRKVGAEFSAHCSWKGLLEHSSPHEQLWGWEGAVLLHMSFHVNGISPPPPLPFLLMLPHSRHMWSKFQHI